MTLVHSGWNGQCPLCGTKHAACGPPTTTTPVDENVEVAAVAGPLKKYRVTSGGVETVMKLNQDDAAARGLTDSDLISGASDAPRTAAKTASEPDMEPAEKEKGEPEKPEEKATAPTANKARTSSANKARSPRAKGGAGGGD